MTQPSGQPSPTDDWRAVSPPEPVESTPPMPGWVKPALAAVAAVLVLGAGLLGASLGTPPTPEPSPTPSPSPTPAITLEPPVVVDEFVRGQSNNTVPPGAGDQTIVQADYTDGEDTVVFVMTWPAPDVKQLMEDAGVDNATETGEETGRFCGESDVTGQAACGELVDDVGILLASVTDQSETTISALLDRFNEELGQ